MRACFLWPKCDNFARIEMSFPWKDDFLYKTGIFCKSIAGPLPSIVQVYTQRKIKLIICQIRHELSVTIHEISSSWKKTLDGGTYIRISFFFISLTWKTLWNLQRIIKMFISNIKFDLWFVIVLRMFVGLCENRTRI